MVLFILFEFSDNNFYYEVKLTANLRCSVLPIQVAFEACHTTYLGYILHHPQIIKLCVLQSFLHTRISGQVSVAICM